MESALEPRTISGSFSAKQRREGAVTSLSSAHIGLAKASENTEEIKDHRDSIKTKKKMMQVKKEAKNETRGNMYRKNIQLLHVQVHKITREWPPRRTRPYTWGASRKDSKPTEVTQ